MSRMSVIHLSVVGTEGDPRSPSALLMRDENGQEYRVALTNGAARTAPAAPAQLAMAVTSLSVRDIQAAIRAGRTRQELVDEFGEDPERIARFEGPVLAERSFLAQRAKETVLRRPDGPRTLEDIVSERITAHGDDAGSLEWDAWRRDDGRWTVTATWLTLGSDLGDDTWAQAQWIFDQVGLTIVPADSAATDLVALPPTPQPTTPTASGPAGGDPYLTNPTDDLTAIARAVREEPAAPASTPAPEVTQATRPGATWTPVIVTGGRADDPASEPARSVSHDDDDLDETDHASDVASNAAADVIDATTASQHVMDARPEVPAALRDDRDDSAHRSDVAATTADEDITDTIDWDDSYDGVDGVDDAGNADVVDDVMDDADEVMPDITDTQPLTTFTSGERSRAASTKRRSVPSWDEILFGSSPTTRDPQ